MIKNMLVALALLTTPLAAHAVVIYDWAGTCTDSNCPAVNATGVLTLDDSYTPGSTVAVTDHGTDYSPNFTVTFDGGPTFTFTRWDGIVQLALPAVSGYSPIIFGMENATGEQFSTIVPGGDWYMFPLNFGIALGKESIFTLRTDSVPVPEPTSLGLLGLGLAGLSFGRWRKRQFAASV